MLTLIVRSDICKIILAIILPPIGVFLERGCGADLLINILLTILGKLPQTPTMPTTKDQNKIADSLISTQVTFPASSTLCTLSSSTKPWEALRASAARG